MFRPDLLAPKKRRRRKEKEAQGQAVISAEIAEADDDEGDEEEDSVGEPADLNSSSAAAPSSSSAVRYQWIQLFALIRKHMMQKRRNKRQFMMECTCPLFLIPIVILLLQPAALSPSLPPACLSHPCQVIFPYRCDQLVGPAAAQRDCIDYAYVAEPALQPLLDSTLWPEVQRLPGRPACDSRVPAGGDSGEQCRPTRLVFDSEADLFQYRSDDNSPQVWGAVIFKSPTNSLASLSYSIAVDFFATDVLVASNKYWQSGFVELQMATEQALLNAHRNDSFAGAGTAATAPAPVYWDLWIEPFPARPTVPSAPADGTLYVHTFLLFTMFSTPMVMGLVVGLVTERSQRLLETMKMMGLSESTYVASWCISAALTTLVALIALAASLAGLGGLKGAQTLLILLCALLAAAMQGFGLLVGALFDSPLLAARGSSLFLVATYGMFVLLDRSLLAVDATDAVTAGDWFLRGLLALPFPSVFFGKAVLTFLERDLSSQPVFWAHLSSKPECAPILWALLGLPFSALFFFTAQWYVRRVFPGEYGVAESALFFLRRSYWSSSSSSGATNTPSNDNSRFHHSSSSLSGIEIQNLVKVYNAKSRFSPSSLFSTLRQRLLSSSSSSSAVPRLPVRAVDGLSASFALGEITAFLGPNGAGKTTTIAVLTGLLPPTSGDATVLSRSVRQELAVVRRSLGVCPQHDVLFPLLSAYEHMWLYAAIKGVDFSSIAEQSRQLLLEVGLSTEDLHRMAESFSGGMKRKLAVAIAFVGNSRCILLDEPSGAMDPHSRRQLWSFLQKRKKNRVILLTTHSMEEAESLGDKIAIVSRGRLRASGTALQLKKEFGLGYQLHVLLGPDASLPRAQRDEARAQAGAKVRQLIANALPDEALADDAESAGDLDLTFKLPMTDNNVVSRLLRQIDELVMENASLVSYSLSVVTLEQVFLAIAEEGKLPEGQSKPEEKRIPLEII